MKSEQKITARETYALAFGLFLGLAILKFGNPVILDSKIETPNSFSEFWIDAWPTHWANWILFPLVIVGAILVFTKKPRWPQTKWPWLLPLLWFGWQLFSATNTVAPNLTETTLWQFAGCVACYFLGAFLFGSGRALNFLLIGILAAFTLCLVRAIDQRLFEYPQTRQMLVEGEREHWTNLPPEMVLEMKRDGSITTTNGVDMANPELLKRLGEGRVSGTMVYSNALAGVILLLLPVSLVLAFGFTKKMKSPIRIAALALSLFLGGAGFFWTGSKFGWLIAIGLGGLCLLRLRWPLRLKIAAVALIAILGLGIFAVRFHHYFAKGATSLVARFDYWRAAAQTTLANPLFGTGPGTFQKPYAEIKSPEAEMARLTHNDYLEQFSDSGIPGGIFYAAWIFSALTTAGRKIWRAGNPIVLAMFLGLLGWFIQGVGEFGLYIPASAWTAFTLLGCLLGLSGNQMDKPAVAN
ncbi:MAG TPA: O-antigen ligase family protein [Candidatus Aquilonibacter sp.]|nr:O-antigen ligase family protein [Candidatus Aquilonibacter sp.]